MDARREHCEERMAPVEKAVASGRPRVQGMEASGHDSGEAEARVPDTGATVMGSDKLGGVNKCGSKH